ncbi:hypothetical protein, partial [Paenibacillus dendritiformis]|uniref:hypothetical protein n=1 Tax=Paenibacillus dendritiformis TaxID=130049 RepID=UPI001BCEF11B
EGWGKAKTPSPLHSLSPNTTFSQQNDITLILLRKKQGFSNSLVFAGIPVMKQTLEGKTALLQLFSASRAEL